MPYNFRSSSCKKYLLTNVSSWISRYGGRAIRSDSWPYESSRRWYGTDQHHPGREQRMLYAQRDQRSSETDESGVGRWTYRLIPIFPAKINRKLGEPNFFMTQFLSGHGCFWKYLHRFGYYLVIQPSAVQECNARALDIQLFMIRGS